MEDGEASAPTKVEAIPQGQKGDKKPIVIIEETSEGQKKHVFYGDVKMVGKDGKSKSISSSIDQEIQKEQEEIEKFIQAKQQRLKELK